MSTSHPAQNICLTLYFLLLAALVLTTFWPEPVDQASKPLMLAIKLGPLLVFLPGLLRGENRTYIWLGFVLMLYFTALSTRAYLSQWDWAPVLLTSLTLGLFLTSLWKIRASKP